MLGSAPKYVKTFIVIQSEQLSARCGFLPHVCSLLKLGNKRAD
jgi:hypothetical protein